MNIVNWLICLALIIPGTKIYVLGLVLSFNTAAGTGRSPNWAWLVFDMLFCFCLAVLGSRLLQQKSWLVILVVPLLLIVSVASGMIALMATDRNWVTLGDVIIALSTYGVPIVIVYEAMLGLAKLIRCLFKLSN